MYREVMKMFLIFSHDNMYSIIKKNRRYIRSINSFHIQKWYLIIIWLLDFKLRPWVEEFIMFPPYNRRWNDLIVMDGFNKMFAFFCILIFLIGVRLVLIFLIDRPIAPFVYTPRPDFRTFAKPPNLRTADTYSLKTEYAEPEAEEVFFKYEREFLSRILCE